MYLVYQCSGSRGLLVWWFFTDGLICNEDEMMIYCNNIATFKRVMQIPVMIRSQFTKCISWDPSGQRVQIQGFGFFASVTGFFCYGGLVEGFFATVGVGGFLRQCWGGFLRQWKGFWLRQGRLFASVGVFCDGNRGLLHRHTSAAERGIKKANLCGRL